MRFIPTGFLLVTCCGLTACANQVDDFGLEEHIGSVSQAAAPPDNNGLDVFYVATSNLLSNTSIANDLINYPLTTSSLRPSVINVICASASGIGSDKVFEYIAKCALSSNASLSVNCSSGTRTYYGSIGLNPDWAGTSSCDTNCQEYNSACVLAHSNFSGETINIQVDGASPNLSAAHDPTYGWIESAFWGNLYNFDGANPSTLLLRRSGCYGTNAYNTYYSTQMGRSVPLMARACGYFNLGSQCDWCSTGLESGNACTGTNTTVEFYLGNLDSAIGYKVKPCASLCTWTTSSSGGGYYKNCPPSKNAVGYGNEITVWRQNL